MEFSIKKVIAISFLFLMKKIIARPLLAKKKPDLNLPYLLNRTSDSHGAKTFWVYSISSISYLNIKIPKLP